MSMHNDIERRVSIGDLTAEERAVGQETKLIVKGYAVRFGQRSVDLGGFTEIIEAGAFTDVLKTKPDVRCLFNHDANVVLGRTTSGTLTLTEDKVGLLMECELPNTAQGRPIYESIRRGDISGQSFSFRIGKEGRVVWNGDYTERKIERIQELYDVGPVTYPAYPSTDVAARTREAAMREAEAQRSAPDGGTGKEVPKKATTMNTTERRAKAKELSDAAQALLKKGETENRETTAEEREDAKRMMDEADGHTAQADLEERAAAQAAKLASGGERRSTAATPQTPSGTVHSVRVMGMPKHFRSAQFGTLERAQEAAFRSGQWALASLFGNERAQQWCRDNGLDFRAIGGSTNAKGGYLVPVELETAIVNLMEVYGVARPNCRIVTMGSDTKDVPIRLTGLTAYPVGEASELTESDKTWGLAKLVARKWGVLVRYSSEISEDAVINMADDLAMETGQAFAYAEDNALINGDGSVDFHGITGILSALAAGSIKACAATHTTFAKVDDADITTVIGLLPSYALAGAKIFCSPVVKGAVFDRLLRAAGGNTQQILAGSAGASYGGLPIVTTSLLNATDGASATVALIGNMAQAVAFGDRRSMTMRVSSDRYLEYDQTAIMATERFDINVHGKGTATANGVLIKFTTHS